MGLGKWLALAGGIAGTAFTGNPTFAMMGVSGFNALNNKEGVDKAVGQQQAATDQAVGVNRETLGPYAQRGNTAGNTLMGLMGLGPLPGQAGFGGAQTTAPADTMMPAPLPTVKGPEGGGENVPSDAPARRVPMVQNPDAAMTQASMSSQSGYGPRFAGLGSMGSLVPVRGPNGQTYRIPPDRLEEALSQGGVQL